jgi:hypothetical protein
MPQHTHANTHTRYTDVRWSALAHAEPAPAHLCLDAARELLLVYAVPRVGGQAERLRLGERRALVLCGGEEGARKVGRRSRLEGWHVRWLGRRERAARGAEARGEVRGRLRAARRGAVR